ncbi:cell filamentation protein Fic [Enterovibrio norvegicus]|uniref:protein adenylyltransferase n=3 Tax=Enterovibrio norvegicus TaxID=188144 RepID=A0A1I5NPR3_9GAMM|nr:Fic family protein [Enterovibrio norvegicus]OEF53174.1 cell filamentation protein Fic [Enterovibrio norvegicus]SFP23793.1 cell filamentation protein [Enterovibrio norvegicus DSM 15893]
MSRYDVDTAETQFQPGSGDLVLVNKLNINDINEIDDVEAFLLMKLYEKVFSIEESDSNISFTTIIDWHRQWLGNVYLWAGKIRNVRMWKSDFEFTAPLQIERAIHNFESDYLSQLQGIENLTKEDLVSLLARSHVEFILIHPFREGNGRISRLLMDYMSQKTGYGLLDYSLWDKHKEFYIRSIHAGVGGDYQYMERLVRDILDS